MCWFVVRVDVALECVCVVFRILGWMDVDVVGRGTTDVCGNREGIS